MESLYSRFLGTFKCTQIAGWTFTLPLSDLQNRDRPVVPLSPKQPLQLTNCRMGIWCSKYGERERKDTKNICPPRLVFFNPSPFPSALGFIKMVSVHLARASPSLFLQNPLGCLPLLGIWKEGKNTAVFVCSTLRRLIIFLFSEEWLFILPRWKTLWFRPASRSNYRAKNNEGPPMCNSRSDSRFECRTLPASRFGVIWISLRIHPARASVKVTLEEPGFRTQKGHCSL